VPKDLPNRWSQMLCSWGISEPLSIGWELNAPQVFAEFQDEAQALGHTSESFLMELPENGSKAWEQLEVAAAALAYSLCPLSPSPISETPSSNPTQKANSSSLTSPPCEPAGGHQEGTGE